MELQKKKIAIDMDEVMADPIAKFIKLYNQDCALELTLEALHGKEIYEVVPPEHSRKTWEYLNAEGFFRDLEVIPDSQEVIKALMERYEVFIVSAGMEFRNSLIDKFDWLQDHFPFISWRNYVLCGDKSIIGADIMIDDRPRNLITFSGERKLLFTSPHNVNIMEFERVSTWREVAEKLL
ncbi:5'(3')-deoxyribonucleotidase [Rufibacter sp. XAAS-G3-1]|uniref:5' nucleotidase, NT5C type n=1 Tax=Rufibacter sp. XAAS-G3-1 TaxID=2729134 RepID=UPI001C6287C7|nr:5'(3')-deoxyribonucleotidase [Rufibacter sp. XAAS-G3-1]